ncbi:aminotransferase class V-fold PLP-dependent enzyme [Flavihumibacter sp. ZG627]|uniref:aminotransferase class V-fold PLP-dependent enzyme n=1 Tax=Flavihumibacter sp. ZG627 TaxID=1463156 RepID=UPI0009077F05|nr:aminotransferase class V-fold PLP-dependent enzyme [Flavihumibacter sp. ZG627]
MSDNREQYIPPQGEDAAQILEQIKKMKEEDVHWKEGRAWSLVYYVNEEHDQLLKAASNELFSANCLNPFAFKSLHRMEQEVVHMTAHMLHGNKDAVGVMSSGGTESILLAMFCYRQRARKLYPRITNPEVVAPLTIHPAFDKAAILFGIRIRKARVDENQVAIPGEMEKLINANTILLVASAPSYPNGVLDPIEAIGKIASQHQLPLHIDACIGGFMLPWVEKLGYNIPPWDFRVPAVTSISADVHKFGYGAKGASVLVYKHMDYLHHQFVITTDFPGGIYISPTLLGTRPGGPIAAAWAALKHLGEDGYLSLAGKLMEGIHKLRAGLSAIPGINIIGQPCMNLISYTTVNNSPDIFIIADQLEDKGWMVDRQQLPNCIHLTVLPTNVDVIDQYLLDLKTAIMYASENPRAAAKGNAAIYGLMARIPFRGMVEKSVKKIMVDMYGAPQPYEVDANGKKQSTISDRPSWMGFINRLLAAWGRFRGLKLLFLLMLLHPELMAQPYVDPLQVRYTHGFRNSNAEATPFNHIWVGSDIPIKLKDKTYLLLSPFYEQWRIDSADRSGIFPTIKSIVFPVGLILPIGSSKWSLTVIPMVRTNGEKLFGDNTLQVGGASFASYARKQNQKFRFGVYVNNEFTGFFIWPLLGADWRLDEKNYIFGLLPGRLTYEHKWSEKFYGGASFRAITNSYRLLNGHFLRIEDNQVSLYLDYYPAKKLCLTLEPGYGVLRKMRTGINSKNYISDDNMGDGPFIRLSSSYRIRL